MGNSLKDILTMKGTYLFCPRCGSPAVSHARPGVKNHSKYRIETYSVKCCNCGLSGIVEEKWWWADED